MTFLSYRVLIVDDELPIRKLLKGFLKLSGHECVAASNGVEALRELSKCSSTFDAVVTDVVMPEMDGIALVQEISQKYPDLPVMVMTGFSDKFSAQKAINAGASEFIKKPFSITEFSFRLNKMIQNHKDMKRTVQKQRGEGGP